MVITPAIYQYCKTQNWIRWDLNIPFQSFSDHATFALCLLAGYVTFYRIVIFIYMKLKVCDVKMWHNLKKTQEDPESQLKDKSHYQAISTENLDVVDGKLSDSTPKVIRTISHPLLVESDLARIHIKHETRPLHSVTLPRTHQPHGIASPTPSLRSAPPVPATPPRTPGLARKVSQGVIMSPDVLMDIASHQKHRPLAKT
ncbi:CG13116 [Drosophila busckii]|uniref:CG13116 n=2 Tax=Drosophila busckii TaxID=30019 RepID=A0A0M4EQ43_DROBS|nr:maker459 [Drosophila busckii]ALC39103.1 CG13116 [Drosophila busckii]